MDSSTLIAILLVGAAWFMWQMHMQKKYPPRTKTAPKKIAAKVAAEVKTANPMPVDGLNMGQFVPGKAKAPQKIKEHFLVFSSPQLNLKISSKGMGMVDFFLKKYKNRKMEPMRLGIGGVGIGSETSQASVPQAFSTYDLNGAAIDFSMVQKDKNSFYGQATMPWGLVEKTMLINPESYSIDIVTKVKSPKNNFSGLAAYLSKGVEESLNQGGGFFVPSFEVQEFVLMHDNKITRWNVDEKVTDKSISHVNTAALSTQYFAQIIFDKSKIIADAKPLLAHNKMLIKLDYKQLLPGQDFMLHHSAFIGPKKYKYLHAIDDKITKIINFGWFSFFAKWILLLMQYFYKLVGNWGGAVVMLTIVVRILVLPFNIVSYRSMRLMTKIQPLIKEVQKKYKDDPQERTRQLTHIMRENKANPLMGCLPMFVQIPIFFALYRVLASSIELYQAPFVLWIHDLSLKDPFYVLPLLVGGAFFVQQKITPSTLDDTQKKVMMIMPFLFTILMLGLPSGLSLYILVSTVFGLVQQYIFTKSTEANA